MKLVNMGAHEEKVREKMSRQVHLRHKPCEMAARRCRPVRARCLRSATLRTFTEESPSDYALNQRSEKENKCDEGETC